MITITPVRSRYTGPEAERLRQDRSHHSLTHQNDAMSDHNTLRHPFIEVLPKANEMKRGGSPSDPDGEPFGKTAKRAKTSRACDTCRQVRILLMHSYFDTYSDHIPQQKTRCEPSLATSERPARCSRCARFNIECSLQRSPSSIVAPQNFANTRASGYSVPSKDRTEFPTDFSSTPYTPSARGPPSSSHTPAHLHNVSEERLHPLRHPITPMSPPRSIRNLAETQTPMDMATTPRHTWSRNNTNSAAEVCMSSRPSSFDILTLKAFWAWCSVIIALDCTVIIYPPAH